MLNRLLKMFLPTSKSPSKNILTAEEKTVVEEKSKHDLRREVVDKILKMRVPGYEAFDDSDRYVKLLIKAPLPAYGEQTAYLEFRSNKHNLKTYDGQYAEDLLSACQYDDIICIMPKAFSMFYGSNDIVILKKGETFESLAILVDVARDLEE